MWDRILPTSHAFQDAFGVKGMPDTLIHSAAKYYTIN